MSCKPSKSPSPFFAGTAAGPGLLVTPESVLLYPGGRLEVLPGMYDGAESEFSAPEMTLDHEVNVEKVVYKSVEWDV